MNPDIMQPPAAPHSMIFVIFSSLIPPIPYTGILTAFTTSVKNSSPLGGRPFLQSVTKTCPANTKSTPSFCAFIASSGLWIDVLTDSNQTDSPLLLKIPDMEDESS